MAIGTERLTFTRQSLETFGITRSQSADEVVSHLEALGKMPLSSQKLLASAKPGTDAKILRFGKKDPSVSRFILSGQIDELREELFPEGYYVLGPGEQSSDPRLE